MESHRRSPRRLTVGYSACAPVECFPVLLVLATVAAGATGGFSSKVASTTISEEVTVGEGSTATTVNPATATGAEGSTSTETASTGETQTESSGSSSNESTTGGGSGADVAAGKSAFTSTCGGCHKLKDAARPATSVLISTASLRSRPSASRRRSRTAAEPCRPSC